MDQEVKSSNRAARFAFPPSTAAPLDAELVWVSTRKLCESCLKSKQQMCYLETPRSAEEQRDSGKRSGSPLRPDSTLLTSRIRL